MTVQYIQPNQTPDFYRRVANVLNDLQQRKANHFTIDASSTIDPKINAPDVLLVSAASGAVTVTLPAVGASEGLVMTIKKIDASANAVTIDGAGAETIDGAATKSLASQYKAYTVMSDGTEWRIIAAV